MVKTNRCLWIAGFKENLNPVQLITDTVPLSGTLVKGLFGELLRELSLVFYCFLCLIGALNWNDAILQGEGVEYTKRWNDTLYRMIDEMTGFRKFILYWIQKHAPDIERLTTDTSGIKNKSNKTPRLRSCLVCGGQLAEITCELFQGDVPLAAVVQGLIWRTAHCLEECWVDNPLHLHELGGKPSESVGNGTVNCERNQKTGCGWRTVRRNRFWRHKKAILLCGGKKITIPGFGRFFVCKSLRNHGPTPKCV